MALLPFLVFRHFGVSFPLQATRWSRQTKPFPWVVFFLLVVGSYLFPLPYLLRIPILPLPRLTGACALPLTRAVFSPAHAPGGRVVDYQFAPGSLLFCPQSASDLCLETTLLSGVCLCHVAPRAAGSGHVTHGDDPYHDGAPDPMELLCREANLDTGPLAVESCRGSLGYLYHPSLAAHLCHVPRTVLEGASFFVDPLWVGSGYQKPRGIHPSHALALVPCHNPLGL